jgi:hypothetical protein
MEVLRKMWKWLEAFELTGEIGLRYMLILLIIIGCLISFDVITSGRPFDYGFMKPILDSSFALMVLVGVIIITRELWFFRVAMQAFASGHDKTVKKAEEMLKKIKE